MIHNISVGDNVFIYSINLNEVIEGRVEGFEDSNRTRVKVLQKVLDGYLRHIVSWVYVFEDKASAESELRSAFQQKEEVFEEYKAGMTVALFNKENSSYLSDKEGNTLIYQIVAVYKKERKVSLVTSYGELIGKYSYDDISIITEESIFKSRDYEIGQSVVWINHDDVYEGIITKLTDSNAEVMNVKKLMPADYKVHVPYYKIPSDLQNTPQILTTLIGDNLED